MSMRADLAKSHYRPIKWRWLSDLTSFADSNFIAVCALVGAGIIASLGLQLVFQLPPETWTSFADFP